jgi:NCS1 family nucleobase:cation symporter-1
MSNQAGSTSYGEKVFRVEPFSTEHIPLAERHGRARQLFPLWLGANLTIADYALGFLPVALGLPWWLTILAILVGNLAGGALLGLAAAMGPGAGYPQLVLGRRAFGRLGGYLPAALNWISTVGWFTVNNILGAFGLQILFPGLSFATAALILVVVQVLLAVYGHNLIHYYERVMSVVLGVLFIVASIITLTQGQQLAAYTPHGAGLLPLFAVVLAAAFSYIASWAPYASDYSRYMPPSTPLWSSIGWTWLGSALASAWLELLGAAVAILGGVQGKDPIAALRTVMGWFGLPAVVAVILGGTAADALNLYSNSLSARALDVKLPRWLLALVAGAVGLAGSLYGGGHFGHFYENFLLLLGYWVTPWLGVLCVDYYLTGKSGEDMNRPKGTVNGPGLAAYLAGILVSVPFMSGPLFTGPIAARMGGADFSFYIGFVAAGVLYLLLGRLNRSPSS